MRTKCRIWWPEQAVSVDPSSKYILFGWFISSCSNNLDVVVAFISQETSQSQIMEDLHRTNATMPSFLQDDTILCPLGLLSATDVLPCSIVTVNNEESIFCHNISYGNGEDTFDKINDRYSCHSETIGGKLLCSFSPGDRNWIRLIYDSEIDVHGSGNLIPKLHHIHWDGEIICNSDVHVILYEVPTFGVFHLPPSCFSCSEQMLTSLRRPSWLHELHSKQPHIKLDTIIHVINCVAAARSVFHRSVGSKRYLKIMPPVAFVLASCSAVVCIVLQLFYWLLDHASCWSVFGMPVTVFHTTWMSIRLRCSQFLYWPVYLGDDYFSCCVEYAERSALQRHSLWVSMVVDILLGNAIGLALLCNVELVRVWVFALAREVTNNLLRSGCVWLMGVPAGFKLNTELATVLGMISLNTIQMWSTICFSLASFFEDVLQGLAVLGMIFGITTTAAFIKDIIGLAVIHITALHWALSLIYSWQIQAIASLWRLFRGQKWNPLRERLDNYDYTVEQHIVGSLLFTPLLLLLPTTSVFYIFFSLVSASISVLGLLIEVVMLVVHATPYLKILLWIVSPRRFPSGIWFKVLNSPYPSMDSKSSLSGGRFTALVSQLRVNCLTFGEIILPYYRYAFSGVSPSFFTSAFRGLFTGKRFPKTLSASYPARLPWYTVSTKEYWRICYASLVSRRKDDRK